MKFVEIEIIVIVEEKKAIIPFLLNPESVIGIVKAGVPGDIAGPDGELMLVEKAALDVGFRIIITNYDRDELRKMLEEA